MAATDFFFERFGEDLITLREQAPWPVPTKVVVTAALCGSLIRRSDNPHQPYVPSEVIEEAERSLAAGASGVHVHVRNAAGFPTSKIDAYWEIVNTLRQRYGDNVVIDGCTVFRSLDLVSEALDGGLLEMSPVNTTAGLLGNTLFACPPTYMQEHARRVQAAGLQVQLAIYRDADLDLAARYLLDPGIVSTPTNWIILLGMPGCTPVRDPFSLSVALPQMVREIRQMDPHGSITVCSSGRASIYIAALACLLGCEGLRVGMEDAIYRWPHRDELLTSSSEAVADIVQVCRALGREVATPEEHRAMFRIQPRTARSAAEQVAVTSGSATTS